MHPDNTHLRCATRGCAGLAFGLILGAASASAFASASPSASASASAPAPANPAGIDWVRLDGFEIARTETTVAQFRRHVQATGLQTRALS